MRRRTWLALVGALVGLAPAPRARAAPSVWVIDDGEKIRRDATDTPFERGEQNPVWRPGAGVTLVAMQNESVAIQVVVHADDAPLTDIRVELGDLSEEGGARLVEYPRPDAPPAEALRLVARPIERFVEHFVEVRRASGGRTPGEALGWQAGAGPNAAAWSGPVPDALVPVETAPAWAPYPLRVAPHDNGIVWIDLNVPFDQRPAHYRGVLTVDGAARPLASIPVDLQVVDLRLPDRPVGALAYYDPDELGRRVGPGAEEHLFRLLRAHRVSALHDATTAADVERQLPALDGSLYTRAGGYLGPGPHRGDTTLSLGAYGSLGDPDDASMQAVESILATLEKAGLASTTKAFLYAADEDCASPRARAWRDRLRAARDPRVRALPVGWTCSRDPATQPVDLVLMDADYDPARARAAATLPESPRTVWVYNGRLPQTGTFLLDAEAISPRVNGWLEAMNAIPEWFYWEATYWYDDHGRTPVDPFRQAESFHNADGDWADGDGVLVYPGRQIDAFADRSLGFDGVVPSIRLKNWRRGLEDAGYFALAQARDPRAAAAVAHALVPAAFRDATPGRPPAWSAHGEPFARARDALRGIALGAPAAEAYAAAEGLARRDADRGGPTPRTTAPLRTLVPLVLAVAIGGAVLALGAFAVARRRPAAEPRPAPTAASAGPAHRIPSLDGLRAISIVLVLLGHLAGAGLPHAFGRGATLGVTVFFVISGYLITGLLIGERERTGRISLRRFYARRTLRIFPAFYVFIAGIVVLHQAGLVTLMPGDLAAAATYTMNYHYARAWTLGHVWSLAVEEQFYLLWPALLALLGLSRGVYAALAAIALGPIVRIALYALVPASRPGLDQMFPTVADTLATGCLLALMQRRLSAWTAYRRWLASPAFAVVPLAIVAAVVLDEHPKFDNLVGQTIRNVAIALIIDRAVRCPGDLFGRFLNARPVAFVGTLSYSLYLWQQPFINRHAAGWMNHMPQSVVLAAVAAYASYRLVERPVLAWRDGARRRARGGPPRTEGVRTAA